MSDDVHRQIARKARERGWLSESDIVDIMLELGEALNEQESVDVSEWSERGWLTKTQLLDVLGELQRPEGTASDDETFDHEDQPETQNYVRGPVGADESGIDEAESDAATDPTEGAAPFETQEAVPPRTNEGSSDATQWDRELTPTSSLDGDGLEEYTESQPDDDTLTSIPDSLLEGDVAPLDLGSSLGEESTSSDTGASPDELTDGPDPTEHRVGAETTSSPEIPPIDPSGEGPLLNAADRFVFDRELGSGGSGRVVRVYDRLIGRSVAMKILQADDDLDAEHLERFIVEAQATGQLEHPNIVPVYDFGVVGDGTPFYTMREVRGESLRDVLAQLSEGDEYAHEEYTLVRLINLLRQISQAVHYAHVRSVIHRDLKPGNVMLGDYGEVLVMDWGLARTLEQGPPGTPVEETTSKGYTLGTPSFMPPEQARGELDEVDEASDIYGLGAILYQILTLSRPYTGTDATDVMWKVVEGELAPPSERAPDDRRVPDELEQICLKAMRADKDDRFGSARQLYEELESWLEGLQPRRAEQHRRQGDRAAEQYRRLLDESDGYGGRARDVEASLDEWASAEERERLWALEDQRDEKRAASNRAFCKAVIHYRQAIAHDPDADRAEEGLADLYWTRLRRAEKRGADRAALYFKSLLEHHDPGKYEDRLEEQVDLDVASSPADVSTTLARYETSNRRLIPGNRESLGTTPTRAESVAFGSYLLEFAPSDRPNVRRPVDVDRETERTIDVRLPPASAKREGFVYVPAGDYLTGGDPDAFDPSPPERIHVGGFFCARFPVTFGEYLAWFNELYDEYGEAAMERAPQTRQAEGLLVRYDEESGRWVPDEILIEGTARERYPEGEGHEFDLPVLGIRAEDAEAYCRWRSERDGRDYRLPTADELEKAGRGVDGRYFPWGNDFVETYCKMRDSRPENPPQPEPVGAFEEDVSPYGVRDLAGGVQEWCANPGSDDDHRTVKGGSWNLDARLCRLASSVDVLAAARTAKIGFRLVYDAPAR